MGILTANELRQRETGEMVIDLGGGAQVLCRRPDLPTLVYEGLLPMPLLSAVVKSISEWVGGEGVKSEVTTEMISKDENMRRFVNTWICCTVVQPKIVQPPAPVDGAEPPFEVPPDAVLVTDLTLSTRSKIFRETFSFGREYTAVAEAAERFPDEQPRAGAGPDVLPVQPATVDGSGDH